jgi:hypothetical protein
LRAREKASPASKALTLERPPETATGESLSVVDPSPTWPLELYPQAHGDPDAPPPPETTMEPFLVQGTPFTDVVRAQLKVPADA